MKINKKINEKERKQKTERMTNKIRRMITQKNINECSREKKCTQKKISKRFHLRSTVNNTK